mmetsp:Transcript_2375/g.3604  ORF Transcript_2375/g.3604 Transcript_2375/m.3604 type:complete len:339 (-) Transcript_2375:2036-3052(-)
MVHLEVVHRVGDGGAVVVEDNRPRAVEVARGAVLISSHVVVDPGVVHRPLVHVHSCRVDVLHVLRRVQRNVIRGLSTDASAHQTNALFLEAVHSRWRAMALHLVLLARVCGIDLAEALSSALILLDLVLVRQLLEEAELFTVAEGLTTLRLVLLDQRLVLSGVFIGEGVGIGEVILDLVGVRVGRRSLLLLLHLIITAHALGLLHLPRLRILALLLVRREVGIVAIHAHILVSEVRWALALELQVSLAAVTLLEVLRSLLHDLALVVRLNQDLISFAQSQMARVDVVLRVVLLHQMLLLLQRLVVISDVVDPLRLAQVNEPAGSSCLHVHGVILVVAG